MKWEYFFIIVVFTLGCVSQKEVPSTKPLPSSENEFASYNPIPVSYTAKVKPYSLEIHDTKNKFQFSKEEEEFLEENGFFVKRAEYKQFFDVYNINKDMGVPNFITTDSVLHTYHVLYDYTLRVAEEEKLSRDLETLTLEMIEISKKQYEGAKNSEIREAARKNVAYFSVAAMLLELDFEVKSYVKEEIFSELELIENHSGFYNSPIFGYKEDYSQYLPRGHYTRSEALKKYFKAMMWYGRIGFRLEPTDREKGMEETRQALLIVYGLWQNNLLDLWDEIYQPTAFFVGKTDDLNVYEYLGLMKEVYKEPKIEDFLEVSEFIERAKEYRDPRINSFFVLDTEKFENTTKGFRFMGQRFIPDSYIFQQLVYDKVLDYQGKGKPFTLVVKNNREVRGFPRGLDVMAVFGSKKALEILEEEGDTDYINYYEQMNKLKKEFSTLTIHDWTQNLYWAWLYSLLPLLEEEKEAYPIFMKNNAWQEKELFTALASWSELRHDTILYAKQSYTVEVTSIKPVPELTKGYVEPNPVLYARLASLAEMTRKGLEKRDLLLPEYEKKLEDLENLLISLKKISEKELQNQSLTEEEYYLIWDFGEVLEDILTFENEADESVEIIADVHTDVNSSMVLEEGVGRVFEIFVIVEIEGETYVARGGTFSYYEFKHSLEDRLTDEKWQKMKKPSLPEWTKSFFVEKTYIV